MAPLQLALVQHVHVVGHVLMHRRLLVRYVAVAHLRFQSRLEQVRPPLLVRVTMHV